MKRLSLLLTGLFVAVLVNAQTPTDAKVTAPATPVVTEQKPDVDKVIKFNEDNHDFGQIPNGKPVEFDIIMKNLSNDSIKVENVKVGCGCTTPRYQQGKAYGPGEVFKVTLGFNGYATGAFEKYADISFSNGLSKHVKFHGVGYKVPDTPAPTNGAVDKLKGAGK